MINKRNYFLLGLVCSLCAIFACAGLQPQITATHEMNDKGLVIKADSFKFKPNNLKASQGDVLVLKVENVSDAAHNLTIEDPNRNKVQNVDLPSKKTVEIKVELSKVGIYNFYCNKTFHPTLGMKGQIEVLP